MTKRTEIGLAVGGVCALAIGVVVAMRWKSRPAAPAENVTAVNRSKVLSQSATRKAIDESALRSAIADGQSLSADEAVALLRQTAAERTYSAGVRDAGCEAALLAGDHVRAATRCAPEYLAARSSAELRR